LFISNFKAINPKKSAEIAAHKDYRLNHIKMGENEHPKAPGTAFKLEDKETPEPL